MKMLKFVNTGIVFQEIPDEVTLSINLSNCPNHCPGCHSQYLWQDIGDDLTPTVIDTFANEYQGDITCICFMGGDNAPDEVEKLAKYIHRYHPKLKVGWYSGRQRVPASIDKLEFDYIKVGPYIQHLGCLKDRTTNQRLYKRASDSNFNDITSRFWRLSV